MTYENHFLAGLAAEDMEALAVHLRVVSVAAGQILIEQDAEVAEVHFPSDAQLANIIRFESGAAIETSVIGREGVSGLAPFMAAAPCAWQVSVRSAGTAFTCSAPVLRALARSSPTFMAHLLRLTHIYQAQAAQTAACNAAHRALPRVARWLLVANDLTPGDRMRFTQEELAALLGAQRTTVNEAAQRLQDQGAIALGRGVVRLIDRSRLEALACECYRMQRSRWETLNGLPQSAEPT